MFPSLDTVASEVISFEQMIVISTATMAQIHLMQAFQGLCHPLEVINRGKISFFSPERGRREREKWASAPGRIQHSHNPPGKLHFSNVWHNVFTRKESDRFAPWSRLHIYSLFMSIYHYLCLPDLLECLFLAFIVKVNSYLSYKNKNRVVKHSIL